MTKKLRPIPVTKVMRMIDYQLIRAIEESGLSHYRIAKEAGISPTVVDRFVSGERDLRLGTAAKIAEVLGLRLTRE